MTTQADLFWQWSIAPGAMLPSKRAGPYTLTDSNGGGYRVIWRYDRVFARGGAAMINRIWEGLVQ